MSLIPDWNQTLWVFSDRLGELDTCPGSVADYFPTETSPGPRAQRVLRKLLASPATTDRELVELAWGQSPDALWMWRLYETRPRQLRLEAAVKLHQEVQRQNPTRSSYKAEVVLEPYQAPGHPYRAVWNLLHLIEEDMGPQPLSPLEVQTDLGAFYSTLGSLRALGWLSLFPDRAGTDPGKHFIGCLQGVCLASLWKGPATPTEEATNRASALLASYMRRALPCPWTGPVRDTRSRDAKMFELLIDSGNRSNEVGPLLAFLERVQSGADTITFRAWNVPQVLVELGFFGVHDSTPTHLHADESRDVRLRLTDKGRQWLTDNP